MRTVSILTLILFFLPTGSASAAEPSARDLETERFLLGARVAGIREMIGSETYPMALDLELDGRTGIALLKYRDERDATDAAGSPAAETSPPHGYKYEVAAYRLDRMLGLDLVPVAVLRFVKTDGALIDWIPGTVTMQAVRDRAVRVSDAQRRDPQPAVMNLFDALILNRERHDDDQLVLPRTSKLHLIDHGQAFGTSTWILSRFRTHPASLPRRLLRELEALDATSIEGRMEGLLSKAEIAALLARRDAILKKIAEDRAKHGDGKVFQD